MPVQPIVQPSELPGRSVPEWQGSTPDAAIPKAVKARILLRYGGKCALTGHKFRPGDEIQFDHILALGLGGKHAESNLRPVLAEAHKLKTREDVSAIRKADRVRLKHLGQWPQSKAKLRSRGFEKSRPNPENIANSATKGNR